MCVPTVCGEMCHRILTVRECVMKICVPTRVCGEMCHGVLTVRECVVKCVCVSTFCLVVYDEMCIYTFV